MLAGNHDWWTYLAISAAGGYIYYAPHPTLSYRIHTSNLVGFKYNYFSRYYKRLKKVLGREFIEINNDHVIAMQKIYDKMDDETRNTFNFFVQSRSGNLCKRWFYLYKARVYRQEIAGTLALYIAKMLGEF